VQKSRLKTNDANDLRDVERHLFNLGTVVFWVELISPVSHTRRDEKKSNEGVSLTLNIAYHTDLILCDESDGDSFPPKAAAASNPMHIHLLLLWKVVIDDDGNLLNIDAAGQHVSRDQNPGRACPEAVEESLTTLLVFLSMLCRTITRREEGN